MPAHRCTTPFARHAHEVDPRGGSAFPRANLGRGYESGAYYASFVGFFPADAPQLVVFVGLDRPQGTYYGGAVAAPARTRGTP